MKPGYNRDAPLGRLFNFLTKNYIGALTQKLGNLDIERHFYSLVIVEQGGGEINQKELAEVLKMDKASMVRLVDYLSDIGMLLRKQNPDDRREYHLVLTDKAKEQLPEIKRTIRDMNEAALQGFTSEEKEMFYSMMGRICCNLSSLPSDEILMEFKKIKK